MKKMNLKEKGITIISLVVTIIILLILAGVSIRVVSGDNGLFRKAKEAVDESKRAEYQEELSVIGLGINLEKSSTPISSKEYVDLFEEEMNKQIVGDSIFKGSKVRRKNDETLRIETKEGYIYYVREDETIYIGKAGEVDESEVPDITMGDIKFKYSTEEWTNEDVTVEITIGEEVENKENYVIEYSKDAKNWTRYTQAVPMTENGEIYARAKDKLGDIKVEKYATGEVQNIDKNAPTPGSITMKMASSKAPYEEGTEVYQNVTIELEDGADNEGESGHNLTTCTITGVTGITSISKEPVLLKARDDNYIITAEITTKDNAGNEVTIQKEYTIRTIYAKETKKLTVSDGTYYLPKGFKIAEDSGTKVSDGMVVEDTNENQWVWVPCTTDGSNGSIKYDRYLFEDQQYVVENDNSRIYLNSTKYCYYYEPIPLTNNSEEYKSIEKYGGYYIGRYEAGDKESTIAKEMRTLEKYLNDGAGDSTHTVTIKKGQAPYTIVKQEQCIILSNQMSVVNNYSSELYTRLCNSYAWDTALKFIQSNEKYTNYPNEKFLEENFYSTIFQYIDIDSTTQKTKNKNDVVLVPTGQTTPVCNVYDMGGNAYEYTTEYGSDATISRGLRGGSCKELGVHQNVAGSRMHSGGPGDIYGFRVTLYIK